MLEWLHDPKALGTAGLGLLVALAAALLVHLLFWRLLRVLSRAAPAVALESLLRHCRRPTLLLFVAIALRLALSFGGERLPAPLGAWARGGLAVLLTFSTAWLLIRLLSVAQDLVAARFDIDVRDNLRAREVQTQFRIVRRIAVVVIVVLSVATLLASSEPFRRFGAGILASAGLAGLVVGFAAQKALGNLLAGIQIAFTQPIRLDDVVVVEGEWGRVEEITLTYVVVRIWDLRRLVLPISYFLEKPVQNWTRTSADILGSVLLHLDHAIPIDALRAELRRIVEASDDWDGKVCSVQVTDTSEKSIAVRALVSAADSGRAWDLRCEVREKLIAFVRAHHPECLPRLRANVEASVAPGVAPPGVG